MFGRTFFRDGHILEVIIFGVQRFLGSTFFAGEKLGSNICLGHHLYGVKEN
jgi:hypothetical protein